ncbi:MAG: ABC transporter ATP-binding protein [Bacteroidota bacterium]
MEIVAKIKDVVKKFPSGETEITALKETSLEIRKGELILIIGPSGSGKTTLLLILGGIVTPTSGDVEIRGRNITNMSDNERTSMRLHNIGFVFQNINLIKPLKIIENVSFPSRLLNNDPEKSKKLAEEIIENVGLIKKKDAFPDELSGGEQQRIGVARALVTDPPILLCDEPTASLDSDSLKTVMNELRKSANNGKAVLVVSHDKRLEEYADKIIKVIDGEIQKKTNE